MKNKTERTSCTHSADYRQLPVNDPSCEYISPPLQLISSPIIFHSQKYIRTTFLHFSNHIFNIYSVRWIIESFVSYIKLVLV